jgi:pimeloyl-ACP methyl ester carboxylesterase
MSLRQKTGTRLLKALLPIALLLVLAIVGITAFIVYSAAHPAAHAVTVRPENFTQLSDRGLKVTDEAWNNRDGTQARGWLLRGAEGAPAVVLLHSYGADRSWLLNLGVKINETSNFTILWPDLRGHGLDPKVTSGTSFGAREAEDAVAALDYLRTLKTPQNRPLVGSSFGIYGLEMGAYAALIAASREQNVHALVLDSVPRTPDDLLHSIVSERAGSFDNVLLQQFSRLGARLYFYGSYENKDACAAASSLNNCRVLLLGGADAPVWRASTNALVPCFPNRSLVEAQTDLSLTGFKLTTATGVQGEAYDRRVIEFFDKTLR